MLLDHVRPHWTRAVERQPARRGVKRSEGGAVAGEPRRLGPDLDRPAEIGLEAESIVLIGPVGAQVPADHRRRERLQRRPGRARGEELRRALIREAVHADASIGAG